LSRDTALAHLPIAKILRAVADAAERWSDADFPPRVRATEEVVARTGYSMPVVEYALDRLFFSITESALRTTIDAELGSIEALDGFATRAARPEAWARPVGRVAVISSRTTIGVGIVPAIFALCAKCDVVVKDREDHLVRAFFSTLAEEREEFSAAARAELWTHTETARSLGEFDAVVAFGDDESLKAIRDASNPQARIVAYGSRASAGYITREALDDAASLEQLLAGAARDTVLYESEGCLSLHMLFIENGDITPVQVAERLAKAMERASIELPVGVRDVSRAAQFSMARNMAAFRAATSHGAVFSDDAGTYALTLDPPADEPPLFLPRTLAIRSVGKPAEALAYLRRHEIPLEGFAVSDSRSDVVKMAVDAGAARLVPFGELQRPPIEGEHGGRPRIGEFVRWITRTE
ncbi:MAG: hypothetical protein JO165_09140, partial [Candidatus Eremiobacteraeota bacterium]|nr:hypothetical protein [Candidatus Eremiobacteraeota bacterium]